MCTFRRASSTRVPPTMWSPFVHVNRRGQKYADVGTLVPWAVFERVIPLSTHKAPWSTQRLWSEFGIIKEEVCSYSCLRFLWSYPFESWSVYASPRWLTQETYCYGHHIFPCCGWQCKVVTVPKVIDGCILWKGKRFAFMTEYGYDDPVTTHVYRF